MEVKIEPGWKTLLADEFKQPYFERLTEFVRAEYQNHTCYPKGQDIFAAFDATPPEKARVVIIGQDPYHGPGQAHGLCFSVLDGVKHPPSLVNIFKEIANSTGTSYPQSGNLMRWANQGVLLLNATLTVRAHMAGSHQKQGWEQFTDRAIEVLAAEKKDLVFMLWGGFAKQKKKLIAPGHHILESGHPSPLSANRGLWFDNGHFNKANEILKSLGQEPVSW